MSFIVLEFAFARFEPTLRGRQCSTVDLLTADCWQRSLGDTDREPETYAFDEHEIVSIVSTETPLKPVSHIVQIRYPTQGRLFIVSTEAPLQRLSHVVRIRFVADGHNFICFGN